MPNSSSTVIVDQYKAAATASAGSNSYGGLRIHALPGLHDFLGNLITKTIRSGTTVLDMAAGSGAMSARLRDLGYLVRACDYVTENFRPDDIPFTQANLNEGFSTLLGLERFHAIVASEIIEHLENPRHFFRECHKMLSAQGFVILSTPNLHSSGSLASFVRSGEFLWFSDVDYKVQGHITPLSSWQIDHGLEEAGFKTIWRGSFGTGSTKLAGSPRLRMLAWLIDKVSGTPAGRRGEVYVCIAQKESSAQNAGD